MINLKLEIFKNINPKDYNWENLDTLFSNLKSLEENNLWGSVFIDGELFDFNFNQNKITFYKIIYNLISTDSYITFSIEKLTKPRNYKNLNNSEYIYEVTNL